VDHEGTKKIVNTLSAPGAEAAKQSLFFLAELAQLLMRQQHLLEQSNLLFQLKLLSLTPM
jgi:hypothetical protein